MGFERFVKRTIAKEKIRQRKAETKKIRRLALDRNKAIKDADRSIRKAQMIEDKKDAELRKAKAIGREPVSGKGRNMLGSIGREIMWAGKKLAADIEKDLKTTKKPRRRTTKKRKTTRRTKR